MSTAPEITERAGQPYVAVRAQVTMQTISAIADRIPEVFGWLAAHGVALGALPFLKYNVIDMARGSWRSRPGYPSPPPWTVTAACCRASCPPGGTRR